MNGISEEKYTHIDEIKEQTKAVFDELMEQAKLEEGDILVVGCSSSEIASHRIGSYSSVEDCSCKCHKEGRNAQYKCHRYSFFTICF